jgi:hypothetical protein
VIPTIGPSPALITGSILALMVALAITVAFDIQPAVESAISGSTESAAIPSA